MSWKGRIQRSISAVPPESTTLGEKDPSPKNGLIQSSFMLIDCGANCENAHFGGLNGLRGVQSLSVPDRQGSQQEETFPDVD